MNVQVVVSCKGRMASSEVRRVPDNPVRRLVPFLYRTVPVTL